MIVKMSNTHSTWKDFSGECCKFEDKRENLTKYMIVDIASGVPACIVSAHYDEASKLRAEQEEKRAK